MTKSDNNNYGIINMCSTQCTCPSVGLFLKKTKRNLPRSASPVEFNYALKNSILYYEYISEYMWDNHSDRFLAILKVIVLMKANLIHQKKLH